MKKKISWSFILILVLVVVLFAAPSALAQGPVSWSSAYQIQNLESTDATVQITYYAQGSSTTYNGSTTVSGNGSVTIFPFVQGDNVSGGPGSFNGSVVLSSDKQIAAILNTQTTPGFAPFYGASTNGFSEGATSVSLPLIACNNSGFDTWFNIQNTGTSTANVTVNYVPGSSGSPASDTVTIESNRAKTFDQRSDSTTGTKKCSDLGSKFVGSATVTSDQPVVASVMFLGTGNIKTVQGYNGFTGGSTSINLPLIMANNSSYYTAIQIQNAGTNSTTVTVDYSTNTGSGSQPQDETYTIPAGGSQTLIQLGGVSAVSQNNWNSIGQYIGGATITQTGSEPLVAIVNQNSTQFLSLGSAYEGFNPSNATNTINLPLVAANNSGFLTGIQIQALQANTSVTVTYSENSVQAGEVPQPDTFTLTNAGDSKTLIQKGPPHPVSGVNNWDNIGKYIGSGTVTSDKPIIAIVNFNGPATGDTFFTYDGFNQ